MTELLAPSSHSERVYMFLSKPFLVIIAQKSLFLFIFGTFPDEKSLNYWRYSAMTAHVFLVIYVQNMDLLTLRIGCLALNK